MPFRILIATDVFPPVCGGSGWSTYELARGLRSRGHEMVIVQADRGAPAVPREYDGFRILGFPAPAPRIPFVRNYFRNERLYPRLATFLRRIIARERIDLIHAQHVLTGPAAVRAARHAGIPSVCTVRDYWPVCYWGDLIHDFTAEGLCPGCSAPAMTRCIQPRVGRAWPLAVPAIPYMLANLRTKRHDLSGADAVVAVSRRIAADLRERAPELAETRIDTIPNAVDVTRLRVAVARTDRPMPQPYAVFVGKLARNKGVGLLVEVAERARLDLPLVVIGDGPEREGLARAAARSTREIVLRPWLDQAEVFRWLRHAALLVFPSRGPESLSRVLLEAAALGVPIAAMETGGTGDILEHERTALLSRSPERLAHDVARLAADPALAARLGAAASAMMDARFDAPVVLARMEQLYGDLVTGRALL